MGRKWPESARGERKSVEDFSRRTSLGHVGDLGKGCYSGAPSWRLK